MMVASDGKTSALGTLKVAAGITLRNKLSSFFIVIIAVVLSLAGSLMCYVGHIFTTPITLVLFAVGYLMMTDQDVFEHALASYTKYGDPRPGTETDDLTSDQDDTGTNETDVS